MTKRKDEQDAPFDRLLAGTLQARADAAPEGACLDADTLAAWADEALDARERAAVEAHAADCARCQTLLAAMVKTAPTPAAAASPWRIPALGWLVPVAIAATALVIWVAVPGRGPIQVSDGGAEPVEQEAPPRARAPVAAPPVDARAKAPSQVQPEGQLAERDTATPPARNLRERPPAGPSSPAPSENTASPAASADARSEKADVAGAASSGAASSLAAPAAAAAPAPPQRAVASARAATFATALEPIVVSTNPSTRFRLLRGGGVQRTADAGATWRTEVTGATETLTAGASPSPSVCWLIGPSGMVLLSTDGRSWRRVPFPEAVDLRAVTATDHETATVTTAAGHVFMTTDGGRTWGRPPDF